MVPTFHGTEKPEYQQNSAYQNSGYHRNTCDVANTSTVAKRQNKCGSCRYTQTLAVGGFVPGPGPSCVGGVHQEPQ